MLGKSLVKDKHLMVKLLAFKKKKEKKLNLIVSWIILYICQSEKEILIVL